MKLQRLASNPIFASKQRRHGLFLTPTNSFEMSPSNGLLPRTMPMQALEHPKFKEMIVIASRATNGVKVPTRKAARRHIMRLFQRNLDNLQKRLMSPKAGLISMTCDAWQASNVDADLVVTGRWNEKKSEGVWEQQQVFKIVKRLGFGHKVGWVTCDNASCLNNATWICMAHTINLSSQPLISTYSKTAHFDPDEDAIEDIIPAFVDE
ncbi:hypothetical protein D9613_012516 [Agrocybe pediades]|uniref:Uncharacterized protein n=1 Tax=Agrocybe pediades TaxID=84607 RepID=A0A8H4QS07_9AGAR|nr:hypothetical protein D9613_012516 [Agrocybe pediades]